MNAVLPDSSAWTRRQWIGAVVLAVLVQAGLILWFSEHTPRPVHRLNARPVVRMAPRVKNEWLTLTDPTLFAVPHPEGFSGPAWLTVPPHQYRPPGSLDEPLWLAPTPVAFGAAFHEFVRTSPLAPFHFTVRPLAAPTDLGNVPNPPLRTGSEWEVTGDLARRGLEFIPPLPSWTNAEILAPSVVQVLIDARGNPISAVLLDPKGSGLKAADQRAVDLARAAHFGPDQAALTEHPNDPAAGLGSGRLIFHWNTLPAPVTNDSVNPR